MGKFHFSVALMFDLSKTLKDARLLFHVRRVICLFDEVIEALELPEVYEETLRHIEKVGAGHRKFGMKKENFMVSLPPGKLRINVKPFLFSLVTGGKLI